MKAPFKIIMDLTGEDLPALECSISRKEISALLNGEGFTAPDENSWLVLRFFIDCCLEKRCYCPSCLMEATGLPEKQARKAMNTLGKLGYLVEKVAGRSLH